MSDTATAVEEREATASRSSGTATNIIVKIILVGLIDALLIWAIAQTVSAEWWAATAFFIFAFLAINFVYFSGRAMPLKYLLPGLLFLIVFQLFMMLFTLYASFTNYGTGHLDTKGAAIEAIEQANVTPVPDSLEYPVLPVEKSGEVSMLVTDPETGVVSLGTNEELTEVPEADVQRTGDVVTGLTGYTTLNLGSLTADLAEQWNELTPPLNAEEGTFLKAKSVTRASEVRAGFVYDEQADAMLNTDTGELYPADESVGNFVSPSGEAIFPGWRVTIGVSNYTSLITDDSIRSRFLPITIWTFVFALGTTFLNFALGLLLALVMQERRMRGQGFYRLMLIVPYALPVFLTALLWKGMLNTDFGLINQILTVDVPWLTDPWLARMSVLMVNLWLGYPYFLLVCSGALTAIPGDLKEAAFVDGASGGHAFRTIVLPLLLVATAPLLVTTFAFNFNNYTLIEMLTGGGPFPGTFLDGGDTDLLINYTFRKAFNDANQQLGLASAIALVIFVIVGSVSVFGFRLTKRLEEIGS